MSFNTIVSYLDNINNNDVYIKRDDLIPFSFGGNKARKAFNFFEEIDNGDYDTVVTYGSSSSNHCRVVSNMAAARNMECYIISPEEASEDTYNKKMMELFGAIIDVVPVNEVHDKIENQIENLKKIGKKPYFIPGGGHGNLGTKAYVDCYDEIINYEKVTGVNFDYIFFASGTGTTQAGLVCGHLINKDLKKIIGISIARKNPRGREVILESINDYLLSIDYNIDAKSIDYSTIFIDDYIKDGYGQTDEKILDTIKIVLINYGIPLDATYTGKAFNGMLSYINKEKIENKNILFIHTGGTPLFFNSLEEC